MTIYLGLSVTMKLPIVGVLILQFCLYMAAGKEEAKPQFKMVVDKMTKEEETVTVVETNLSFEEKDENIMVSGELKQLVDLDDNWKLRINILRSESSDGEYMRFMELPPKGVCEMLNSYYKVYLYDGLKEKVANAPAPTECPVLQRTYVLSDYVLDTRKFQKFLKPGYYRFIGALAKDDVDLIRYTFDGHVEDISNN